MWIMYSHYSRVSFGNAEWFAKVLLAVFRTDA